jgi:thioredoxin 1
MANIIVSALKSFKKLHILLKIILMLGLFFLVRIALDKLLWGAHDQGNQMEGFHDVSHGKRVILFHWKDCGHCKKMMPEWQRFVKLNGNNSKVKIETVEKDDAPDLVQKYNVQGFPTIIAINNGKKVKEFEGERTVDDLQRFANSV